MVGEIHAKHFIAYRIKKIAMQTIRRAIEGATCEVIGWRAAHQVAVAQMAIKYSVSATIHIIIIS